MLTEPSSKAFHRAGYSQEVLRRRRRGREAAIQVLGPHEAPMRYLEKWAKKNLTAEDAVVLEMTTNTYAVYDTLKPLVHSVTVVHPPHVALIVRAQVKTDKKAAFTLAQLHAAGLLPGVWIPPVEVREMRALVAHRRKMVKLASIAKCRLHALLHRHDIEAPEGFELFTEDMQAWWKSMKVSPLEKQCMLSDLATLEFAHEQVKQIEAAMNSRSPKTSALRSWCRLPASGLLTAITILAAIGDIRRFPTAKQLVGYAGLGARVHASGETYSTGQITKSGRKELRWAMVQVARHAVVHHPHCKVEYERLSHSIGTEEGDSGGGAQTADGGLAGAHQGNRRQVRQPDPGGVWRVRVCASGTRKEPAKWTARPGLCSRTNGQARHWRGCDRAPLGHKDLPSAAEQTKAG